MAGGTGKATSSRLSCVKLKRTSRMATAAETHAAASGTIKVLLRSLSVGRKDYLAQSTDHAPWSSRAARDRDGDGTRHVRRESRGEGDASRRRSDRGRFVSHASRPSGLVAQAQLSARRRTAMLHRTGHSDAVGNTRRPT